MFLPSIMAKCPAISKPCPKYNSINLNSSVKEDLSCGCTKTLSLVSQPSSMPYQDHLPSITTKVKNSVLTQVYLYLHECAQSQQTLTATVLSLSPLPSGMPDLPALSKPFPEYNSSCVPRDLNSDSAQSFPQYYGQAV